MNTNTRQQFETAQDKLWEAVEELERLKQVMGKDESETVRGYTDQLDAYTIPSLVEWIDSGSQPGSLERIMTGIKDEEAHE